MPGKIIEIGTPGCRLSIKNRQLLVTRAEAGDVQIPFEDIEALIIDDVFTSYSHHVFLLAKECGTAVIFCNAKHMPDSMVLPFSDHHLSTHRHHAQIALGAVRKKRLWQCLVRAKIQRQADVLEKHASGHLALRSMAGRVGSGYPANIEAQAAQRYWRSLFGKDFRRDREEAGINAFLNYGYAIVRACIARNIVTSGFLPSLGIHHSNRGNPFCLADDLIEPYRPFIDDIVATMVREGFPMDLKDRGARSEILKIMNKTSILTSRKIPVYLSIRMTCSSLYSAFERPDDLLLPEGLPFEGSEEGFDAEWVEGYVDNRYVRYSDSDT